MILRFLSRGFGLDGESWVVVLRFCFLAFFCGGGGGGGVGPRGSSVVVSVGVL